MALFVGLDVSLKTTSICVVRSQWQGGLGRQRGERAVPLIKALGPWRKKIKPMPHRTPSWSAPLADSEQKRGPEFVGAVDAGVELCSASSSVELAGPVPSPCRPCGLARAASWTTASATPDGRGVTCARATCCGGNDRNPNGRRRRPSGHGGSGARPTSPRARA